MGKSAVEDYLTCVQKSKLVTKEQLVKVLDRIKRETGGKSVKLQYVAQCFVEAKLVSDWQNEKLLKGRHQGFFLGNYKLLAHIASGGMSNIYLAQHIQMHRQVAIKVLPPTLTTNTSYLERFYVESRAIASLDHKNIVRAYDVAREGKYHYLVLEYVDGIDLRELVNRDGPLPYEKAADFIRQAADGLQHAHAKGLIHRDIKPANLLVDREGVIKVLDLGLSRITHDEHSLTRAHNENVIGTVDYLAPEQAVDSHEVDARADIYGLGGTLYFLLTGHPPYPDGTHTQRLMKHQSSEPTPITQDRPDAPADLVAICQRMMSKKAEDRHQTSAEVSQDLSRWLASRQARAAATLSPAMLAEPIPEGSLYPESSGHGENDSFDSESMTIDIPRMMLGMEGSKNLAQAMTKANAAQDPGAEGRPATPGLDREIQARLATLEKREAELIRRETEIARREGEIVAREKDCKRREAELAARTGELLTQDQAIDERAAAIEVRAADVEAAGTKLTSLDQYLEQKATELELRATDVEKARSKLNRLEQFLEKKATELERRQREVEISRGKLTSLENFLEKKAADLEKRADSIQSKALPVAPPKPEEPDSVEIDLRMTVLSGREQELSAMATRLDSREEELASREMELARREGEIDQKGADVDQRRNEIEKELAAAVEAARRAERERNAAGVEQSTIEHTRQEMARERAALDRAKAKLEEERAVLLARETEIDTRSSEIDSRAAALEARLHELDQREAEAAKEETARATLAADIKVQAELLQRSTKDLERRWEKIEKREAEIAAARKEIEAAKKRLGTGELPEEPAAEPAAAAPAAAVPVMPAPPPMAPAVAARPQVPAPHTLNPPKAAAAAPIAQRAPAAPAPTALPPRPPLKTSALPPLAPLPKGNAAPAVANNNVASPPPFVPHPEWAAPAQAAPAAAPQAKAKGPNHTEEDGLGLSGLKTPSATRSDFAGIADLTPAAVEDESPSWPVSEPMPEIQTPHSSTPGGMDQELFRAFHPPEERPRVREPESFRETVRIEQPGRHAAPLALESDSEDEPTKTFTREAVLAIQAQIKASQQQAPAAKDKEGSSEFSVPRGLSDPWPFAEAQQAHVITTRRIAHEGQPILFVHHESDAGIWRFLDGARPSSDDMMTIPLGDLAGLDPTIRDLAKLPAGWQAWRASNRDPWHKAPRRK